VSPPFYHALRSAHSASASAACVLFRAPTFPQIFPTCFFTVTSSIPSARAISLFYTPFISSLATSSSRTVSFPSIFVPAFFV